MFGSHFDQIWLVIINHLDLSDFGRTVIWLLRYSFMRPLNQLFSNLVRKLLADTKGSNPPDMFVNSLPFRCRVDRYTDLVHICHEVPSIRRNRYAVLFSAPLGGAKHMT